MEEQIPYRNRSPYGWWVATYVIRAMWDDQVPPSDDSTCRAWENTIILQASDREAAFAKAQIFAAQDCSEFWDELEPTRKGRWVLEGLTSLLPIYDELRDGAEILWTEHSEIAINKLRSWVRSKPELEAFNDSPISADGK